MEDHERFFWLGCLLIFIGNFAEIEFNSMCMFLFALLLMLISRDCKDSPYFCSEILQIYFSGKLQSFDHHSVDTKKEL